MLEYDEQAVTERLTALDRTNRTAFAASCALWLLPAHHRYAASIGSLQRAEQLSAVIELIWFVVEGGPASLEDARSTAESLVPDEDGPWTFEAGYAQNAAAAAAYACRTWLSDDPQEPVWAARQLYEAADYAAGRDTPDDGRLCSPIVQTALTALTTMLDLTKSGSWTSLQSYSEAGGRVWAASLPRPREE